MVDFTDVKNFFSWLNTKVNVDRVEDSKRRRCVTSESLLHKWLISLDVAIKTVYHITQKGIKNFLHQ